MFYYSEQIVLSEKGCLNALCNDFVENYDFPVSPLIFKNCSTEDKNVVLHVVQKGPIFRKCCAHTHFRRLKSLTSETCQG